jgi:hypothetical protein
MVRTIEDWAAALTVKVADGLKMKTTYDYSYIGVKPPAQKPAPSCLPRGSVYSLVGDERIAGFEAHHYQRLSTLPDGETLEDHDWFAPGLGCFQIQRIQYRRDAKGNLTGVFEKKPVQVQTGEPENSLFMVPDTYREMKPSDLERAVLLQAVEEREGYDAVQRHKIPAGVEQNWARMDSHYLSVKNHTYGAVKKQ